MLISFLFGQLFGYIIGFTQGYYPMITGEFATATRHESLERKTINYKLKLFLEKHFAKLALAGFNIFFAINFALFTTMLELPFVISVFIIGNICLCLWIWLSKNVVVGAAVRGFLSSYNIIPLMACTILIVLAASKGSLDGINALEDDRATYEALLPHSANPEKIIVLKNIDKGILYKKMSEKNIRFDKWSDINGFSRVPEINDTTLVSCKIFKVYC
jgi:hypothetical protein